MPSFIRLAPFPVVTDLKRQAELVARHRYGVVEMAGGEFRRLTFRRLPTLATIADAWWGRWRHRYAGNRCWLYFNQPRAFPQFLSVVFVLSEQHAGLAGFHSGLQIVEQIATIKGCEALLCDVSNPRISDRLLDRWGWQPHAPMAWHRNFIKRLPAPAAAASEQRWAAVMAP